VEKYCRAGQATDDNTAYAHCFLDTQWYSTNTQSEYVVFTVFYCNSGCTIASQCYVIVHYLSCMLIRLNCQLELRVSSAKEVR